MTRATIKTSAPVAETPTQAVVRAAAKSAEVTDSLGRVLRIRKLSALHKLDLSAILGPENTKNEGVVGPSAVAFSVTAIDGDPVMPPNSYAELRALIGRLDDEGIEAAAQGYAEHFGLSGAAELTGQDLKN